MPTSPTQAPEGAPEPAPVVAVVGATASGKTSLSLDLAERLGGEVVNTDAMQVYRGMDIGTAKLPPAERRGIPHHLLDTLTVRDPLTVAEFQAQAREVAARLRAAGRVPVLVGGSALYTRAILDRFEFPGTDEGVRARLEAELADVGPAAPCTVGSPGRTPRRRPASSPRTAAAPSGRSRSSRSPGARSPRRCRAWSTPTPRACRSASTSTGPPWTRGSSSASTGCSRTASSPRSSGCSTRAWPRGGRPAGRSATARSRPTWPGELTLAEARERTVVATRRFARRQDSWFRKDPRIIWVAYDDPGTGGEGARRRATLSR